MRNTFFLFLFFLLGSIYTSQAQQMKSHVSQSNKSIDIIKVYEMVVADGYESSQIYETLATENFFISNFTDAKKWFEKLFALEPNPEPIAYFRYAKSLEALKDLDKANQYLALYHTKID
ncbi:MAG: hypothetical protein CVU03_08155 [Bacteroidetes bacterium HGW-Bacteroidetes-2]|jgi:tetratricopeptide (TPR) repeat protein|nr:MAG: hypothetical protein CVU03_08155 [Bacteroidetes bacterium HGW-Bacteroidetes-2]